MKLDTWSKQTQTKPILEDRPFDKLRPGRSDYGSAGGDIVAGVIKDEALAGTGGELGLVKFDSHHIVIYFGERAGMRIDVRTDFAEEFSACDKLGGDEDIELIRANGAGANLLFCAEGDDAFLGVDFAYVKGNAAGETDAPSLAEGVIGDSFMFGDNITLHIRYVAGLIKGGIIQDGTVVTFPGETKFHTFGFLGDWEICFGGNCADLLFNQITQGQDKVCQTLRRYTIEEIALVFGDILCFAEESTTIVLVNSGVMTCGKKSRSEFFLQEIPKEREFQKGVAVNAGVGGQTSSVRLAKGFYYDFFKGLGNISKIMRDGQLFAYKGGIGSTAGAFTCISR